ncbi:Uncharacterized protein QTN25_003655 [Entamoeba marina]
MYSAFKPVKNYDNFKFYWGYQEFKPSNSYDANGCCSSSEVQKTKKRRWGLDQKIIAVNTAKAMGVTAAITFLLKNNYEEYCGLSISTLQYWIRQSKGRKRRYYE